MFCILCFDLLTIYIKNYNYYLHEPNIITKRKKILLWFCKTKICHNRDSSSYSLIFRSFKRSCEIKLDFFLVKIEINWEHFYIFFWTKERNPKDISPFLVSIFLNNFYKKITTILSGFFDLTNYSRKLKQRKFNIPFWSIVPSIERNRRRNVFRVTRIWYLIVVSRRYARMLISTYFAHQFWLFITKLYISHNCTRMRRKVKSTTIQ